ncbi:PREDICTED: uncharacterized protein LOC105562010 [Vollenhovia emeryi]|uniref:uncharacterized protein LOC105562010 n=1 Tax=Vollenhovia emeryi TaxID=411798 RepID=UPI0005F4A5A3|nr:PREDICTED: uncharacterized protein LOC105562010 [Vollenhovia emeryi]
MKLLILCVLTTAGVAFAAPGLLKVPKVYNAVITSNQNLSPSRAFPVIQPIIHRTAVGYVPPFYYTQIAPYFAEPEVVHYPQLAGDGKAAAAGNDQASSSTSRLAESTSFGVAKERVGATAVDRAQEGDPKNGGTSPAKKSERVPLSFYPSYHSLYYEPYIYTYNDFNPHPGTYYVDYQPYESLEPIPATTPKNADSGHLLPSFHDEKRVYAKSDREKVPDVPPPPLPTSTPKRS